MKIKFLTVLFISVFAFIGCDKDEDDSAPEEMKEEITLVTYNDVSFELLENEEDNRDLFFSSVNGEVYQRSEITEDILPTIDLVSISNRAFVSFVAANDTYLNPPFENATDTKIQIETNLSSEDFDNLTVALLQEITVTHDDSTLQSSTSSGKVITFENASGKKGAIRVEAINADRVLVDIKVIK